jgi:ABC-2 type transport system permease protein
MRRVIQRVLSQVYKSMVLVKRNQFRLFDVTIWPLTLLFSITLFVGFVAGDPRLIAMVILGIAGWRAIYHMQMEMNTGYMDEYWSNSLNHFIISPIRWIEFFVGTIIVGVIKFLFVLVVYLLVGYFVFGFTIPNVPLFIVGILFLSLYGISIGLITLGFNVIYHENAFAFTWALADVLVLFAGVYYPISIFPQAVQVFSRLLPATYGFEVMKSMLGFGTVNYGMLILTSLAWFLAGIAVFFLCVRHAKNIGRLGKSG